MNINVEITGKIEKKKQNRIGIQLYIKNKPVSYFSINIERKKILDEMNNATKNLLNIEDTFEDYMKLISDLGLEIPPTYKNHWTPAEEWDYYSIGQGGNVEGFGSYEELSRARFRKENYNAFPTRELAEKAVNLSKLDRLILLWQYANDCVFAPDWKNSRQDKYNLDFTHLDSKIIIALYRVIQTSAICFETQEQAQAFIDMYEKEIKETMDVIN